MCSLHSMCPRCLADAQVLWADAALGPSEMLTIMNLTDVHNGCGLQTSAMLLSRSNVKLAATAEAQLYLQHSLPGIPGMLGAPGVNLEDPMRSLYSNHSAPARFGGQPNSPSAYMAQASTELGPPLHRMPPTMYGA